MDCLAVPRLFKMFLFRFVWFIASGLFKVIILIVLAVAFMNYSGKALVALEDYDWKQGASEYAKLFSEKIAENADQWAFSAELNAQGMMRDLLEKWEERTQAGDFSSRRLAKR